MPAVIDLLFFGTIQPTGRFDLVSGWLAQPWFAFLVTLLVLWVTRKLVPRWTSQSYQVQLTLVVIGFIGLIGIIVTIDDDATRDGLFQLAGYVLGAAIALSSTTLVANAMSGFMLRVIRGFQFGDYVRVGEYFGKVSEFGIFHIEIQTESSDLVTLPNMYLVTHPVSVIGSRDPDGKGTCTWVSAEVSLGYDVGRKRVTELLEQAAQEAELESPWVRIMNLGDFSVTYKIAAKLSDVKGPKAANAKRILTAPAQLRAKMMDALHGGGVEIVSPTFMNTRAYNKDSAFIPQPTHRPDPETEDPDVFSKADELARVNQERADLLPAIEAAKERIKNDKEDTDSAEAAEKQLATLQEQLKELDARLADPDAEPDESG